MPELPTGTVTFLFTDVEGSTRLLQRLRDGYGDVLADHRRLLRAAFAEHGGEEIDAQGDAFFVAFRKARDAAFAAAAAQRALAEHRWPDGAELRVRIGLHTGEPSVGEEGYLGLGVHRAARIMAAGHGGQILVSQTTQSLLEDDELPGLAFRDLGEHRLKDLDRPERIYQLDVQGLPIDFPALRTADAPTAFSGREEELAEAARSAVWRARLRTRRWFVAGAAAVVVVAGLAAALFAAFGSGSAKALSQVDSNALGVVDGTSGDISGEISVGSTPSHVAVGDGAAWVTNADGNTVSKVDPATKQVVDTIPVGSQPSGIAVGNGAVWVANSLDGTLTEIDPGSNQPTGTIPVGNGPVGVASTPGRIWVANTGDDTITRLDVQTGDTKTLPIGAAELAAAPGALWASEQSANKVVELNPKTGAFVRGFNVGNGPTGIAVHEGIVWVANSLDGSVSRIDPTANTVTSAPVGVGVTSVAAGPGGVWVSDQFNGTLSRLDPATGQPLVTRPVGNRPQGVALLGDAVLVGVRQSGAGHRGGTLTVRLGRQTDGIDPATAYDSTSWTIVRMTNDGLVAHNQASGLQGTQLAPDLATALPSPTDGGKTYTFTLRPGVRYSNGRTVKASDVRASFERAFDLNAPVAHSTPYYFDGIVGAARCEASRGRCDLSRGIETNDRTRTVTFHLNARDPEFLHKLALPFAYVLPAGTAHRAAGTHPLPATGPYLFTAFQPTRGARLARNPHFREWSKAAQPDGYPDRILMPIGGTPDANVKAVLAGRADLFSTAQSETPPSPKTLSALKRLHASQVHTNAQPATVALFLNTRVPPFDNHDARQAVNYAANRTAAVNALGGPDVAAPTCQILPPAYPGYKQYCPYTAGAGGGWKAPDLPTARELVTKSGTRGMNVTVWSWAALPSVGPFAVKLLRSLGYHVTMKSVGAYPYFGVVGDSRTRAQIGTQEWISDYPTASGFFEPILTCAAFLPKNPGNSNDSEFCDLAIDGQIARARRLQDENPGKAREIWEGVDRRTVDESPWVPLVNPRVVDVLSRRTGNYQYSPAGLGALIDQLWVR